MNMSQVAKWPPLQYGDCHPQGVCTQPQSVIFYYSKDGRAIPVHLFIASLHAVEITHAELVT